LPLFVLFHGAGGKAEAVLDDWVPPLMKPESRARARLSSHQLGCHFATVLDPIVAFVNRALERVFDTVAVDPAAHCSRGFSEVHYALSLGLINGDLFNRVVAFSPGFVSMGRRMNAAVLHLARSYRFFR